MSKDLKEALSSARKADTTHVRKPLMIYTARPCEWGSVKYERANFLRPASEATEEPARTRADFERFRAYLRAARDHISDVLDSMEAHQATDAQLEDVAGMRVAAYAVDLDAKPGCSHGASYLPHIAPACASLNMAITQAVHFGLLPADPGQPWRDGIVEGWRNEGANAGADEVVEVEPSWVEPPPIASRLMDKNSAGPGDRVAMTPDGLAIVTTLPGAAVVLEAGSWVVHTATPPPLLSDLSLSAARVETGAYDVVFPVGAVRQ